MSSIRLSFVPVIFAAALLPGCQEEEEELTHGFVKLEMRRSDSQASDPYIGTSTVTATMRYGECLKAFYDANPSLQQDGPEGETIFGAKDLGGEGWTDRLCESQGVSKQAECEVVSIKQQLDVEASQQLTVTYSIDSDLETYILLFGPLPKKETAGCADPEVRVQSVKGKDSQGTDIWYAESFSPTKAFTDQGGAIDIRAAREQ